MKWKKTWIVVGVIVLLVIVAACSLTSCVGSYLLGLNSETVAATIQDFEIPRLKDQIEESPREEITARDPASEEEVMVAEVVQDSLSAPVLHHADSHAPEEGYGSFDVGVKNTQIGIAFGWHLLWPKGEYDVGGGGCDLVILTPGWYENFQILDGRYEVYDIPSGDYDGWVEVLGQERADEQTANYGCPAKAFEDLPQWESSIPSPP